MRMSAFCTAVLAYVVIGHPRPAVAQVDQQGLALMHRAAANEHVDAMDGRYWLKLEWRALADDLDFAQAIPTIS